MEKRVDVEGRAVAPGKILCIGRNYAAHVAELGNQRPDEVVVFAKPNSSIGSQLIAFQGEAIHYEGELCILIEGGELRYVGFGLDLTKRALQDRLKQQGLLPWEKCKAFRDSALFSPFVRVEGAVSALRVELRIDGLLVQRGGVSDMIFQPKTIVQELLSFTSLEDGDIVMTGTPSGVGLVRQGALYEGSVWAGERMLAQGAWRAS